MRGFGFCGALAAGEMTVEVAPTFGVDLAAEMAAEAAHIEASYRLGGSCDAGGHAGRCKEN